MLQFLRFQYATKAWDNVRKSHMIAEFGRTLPWIRIILFNRALTIHPTCESEVLEAFVCSGNSSSICVWEETRLQCTLNHPEVHFSQLSATIECETRIRTDIQIGGANWSWTIIFTFYETIKCVAIYVSLGLKRNCYIVFRTNKFMRPAERDECTCSMYTVRTEISSHPGRKRLYYDKTKSTRSCSERTKVCNRILSGSMIQSSHRFGFASLPNLSESSLAQRTAVSGFPSAQP